MFLLRQLHAAVAVIFLSLLLVLLVLVLVLLVLLPPHLLYLLLLMKILRLLVGSRRTVSCRQLNHCGTPTLWSCCTTSIRMTRRT